MSRPEDKNKSSFTRNPEAQASRFTFTKPAEVKSIESHEPQKQQDTAAENKFNLGLHADARH